MSYTPPPSDLTKKTFACVKWSKIATHKKSHQLFKSKPDSKYDESKHSFPEQDDYFLSNLLKMADISDKRKKINQLEQKRHWFSNYQASNRGKYMNGVCGEDIAWYDFKRVLSNNNIAQDKNEYPVWRVPSIKVISKSDMRLFGVRLILDKESGVYTFSNIDYLMEIASKHDLVVLGGFLLLKSRFQTMRVGEMSFCLFEEEKELSSCFSRESWRCLRNSQIVKLNLNLHERLANMKISTASLLLPLQIQCR